MQKAFFTYDYIVLHIFSLHNASSQHSTGSLFTSHFVPLPSATGERCIAVVPSLLCLYSVPCPALKLAPQLL